MFYAGKDLAAQAASADLRLHPQFSGVMPPRLYLMHETMP